MPLSSKKPVLIRFLSYLKPVRMLIIGAILCGFFKFLLPVVLAWIIGQLVGVLTDSSLNQMDKVHAIGKYAGIMLALTVISPIFVYWRQMLSQIAAVRVINDLRLDLFAHVQRLSHSFFHRNHSGALASRIISDVQLCLQFINTVMIQAWMHLMVMAVILGYFFYKNWILALLSIAMVPLQIIVLKTLGRRIKENSKKIQEKISIMSGTAVESLNNFLVVKTFTAEKKEHKRLSAITSSLIEMRVRNGRLQALNQVLSTIIVCLAPLIVISVGGYLAIFKPEALPVSLLVTFILMQGKVFEPINKLADMQLILAESLGALERIYELFDTTSEVVNLPGAVNAPVFLGAIEFRDVAFSYQTGTRILDGVSLRIEPFQTIGLVGTSGSGKSTLCSLIPRFYDIQSGTILIDGTNIGKYKLRSLRSQIGIVPQEPLLFSGSVFDNISYGLPEASPEQVYQAAKMAYANEFIERLPEDYDTVIGERGARLSGGQKQRIAIARAFLKNPPILILDEATSALDNESETMIQTALNDLMQNRTTLVIAHRLSTIRHADRIFVLEGGQLAEQGTHEELMLRAGRYAALTKVIN